MMDILSKALDEHLKVMQDVKFLLPQIEKAALKIIQALTVGGRVFFMGNGGSAADAQHLAAELIGRYKIERKALPAVALGTDTSILTALSNDYDYSIVFARQLEAWCSDQDVVIGLSTSGQSENVLKGIDTAKQRGAYTIGFTGQTGGQLFNTTDLCLCVPSTHTPRIQEAHIFMGHMLCELVEAAVVEYGAQADYDVCLV